MVLRGLLYSNLYIYIVLYSESPRVGWDQHERCYPYNDFHRNHECRVLRVCARERPPAIPAADVSWPRAQFMQDNDPKHVSRCAKSFMEEHGVNWWRTPPESPDLNPIENLWHKLKEHLRAKVKPMNQSELVDGIESFWATVNREKCTKYIRHLRKVIPEDIEVQGEATGY